MSEVNTKLKLIPIQTNLNLEYSNSPDIIRSNQRDIQYSLSFEENFKDFLLNLLGNRWLNKNMEFVKIISKFIYYSLTTLLLDQTLGEEYCEILPYSLKLKKLPNFMNRSLSIFLYCSFPNLLEFSLKPIRQKLLKCLNNNNNINESIKQRINWLLLDFTPLLIKFLKEYALPLHLVIFYFKGNYYHLSKRLTSIRYISPNKPTNNPSKSNGYEILGILLGIQLLVKFGLQVKKSLLKWREEKLKEMEKTINKGEDDEVDEYINIEKSNISASASENNQIQLPSSIDGKCALCLSTKTDPTCTPCGHIFCWECISEWCRTKPECPLCRQSSGLAQLWTIRLD